MTLLESLKTTTYHPNGWGITTHVIGEKFNDCEIAELMSHFSQYKIGDFLDQRALGKDLEISIKKTQVYKDTPFEEDVWHWLRLAIVQTLRKKGYLESVYIAYCGDCMQRVYFGNMKSKSHACEICSYCHSESIHHIQKYIVSKPIKIEEV
jgi:hypothetical protein